MSEEHHYSISMIIHKYIGHITHVALEGDFSEKDLHPLPYKEDDTNQEKISSIMKAMSETSIRLRHLEWHPEEIRVNEIEKLEDRYAALDNHLSHLIAENHLEHFYENGLVSVQ